MQFRAMPVYGGGKKANPSSHNPPFSPQAKNCRKRRLTSKAYRQQAHADFAWILALVQKQVDEATFNAAWTEGYAMTMEQAIEYALNESSTP